MAGRRDWKARRTEKMAPLKLNPTEAMMTFETAKAFVLGKAGPNYPSPVVAINVMQQAATRSRDDALRIEASNFARMAKTPTSAALVTIFHGDRYVAKVAKETARSGSTVKNAAVVGAGIMGGGIAYQSASKGIPILMKDIQEKAIQKLKVAYPQWAQILDTYAPVVVAAAEQLRKTGVLPTKEAALSYAITAMQSYLSAHGAKDVDVALIEAAIEAEVGKLPPFGSVPPTTTTTTTEGPTPTTTTTTTETPAVEPTAVG